MHPLFFVTFSAFFVLFVLRHLFIKRKLSIFVYHFILCGILFIGAVGGGSVQNDGYARLEQFIELEKNHKLDHAKHHQKDDSMLAIDLEEFKNSDEFKAHLKKHDHDVDIAEAIFIGWVFLILADIAMMCVHFIRYGGRVIKNRALMPHPAPHQ
jgi:hypothetical protein